MADKDTNEADDGENESCSKRQIRKTAELALIIAKDEYRLRFKKVAAALKKDESERTAAENDILAFSNDVIKEIERRALNREKLKVRQLEIEDAAEVLQWKCHQLALAVKNAKCLVVYTGAGISTSASIPDYRGPNGVWTLLQQGKQLKAQDLSEAEPTSTHMALSKLHDVKRVKYIVSQNCDGLHLRSGLPRSGLSELHGNMFIERCNECKPVAEYIRLFDVTEKTGVRKHKTERKCHKCRSNLKDTIIHFGEKAPLDSPYNWEKAAKILKRADMVLCLGTSLKVLRKYACLWSMHLPPTKRPKLYIVNLQWTPKDEVATLKINGKCDEVLSNVMENLGIPIPTYRREGDPIFRLHTALRPRELKTTSKKIIDIPQSIVGEISTLSKNRSRAKNIKSIPRKPVKRKLISTKILRSGKVMKSEVEEEVVDKNGSDQENSVVTSTHKVEDSETLKWMLSLPVAVDPLHNIINNVLTSDLNTADSLKKPSATELLQNSYQKAACIANDCSKTAAELLVPSSMIHSSKKQKLPSACNSELLAIKMEHSYATKTTAPVTETVPRNTSCNLNKKKSSKVIPSRVLGNQLLCPNPTSSLTLAPTETSQSLYIDVNMPPLIQVPQQPFNLIHHSPFLLSVPSVPLYPSFAQYTGNTANGVMPFCQTMPQYAMPMPSLTNVANGGIYNFINPGLGALPTSFLPTINVNYLNHGLQPVMHLPFSPAEANFSNKLTLDQILSGNTALQRIPASTSLSSCTNAVNVTESIIANASCGSKVKEIPNDARSTSKPAINTADTIDIKQLEYGSNKVSIDTRGGTKQSETVIIVQESRVPVNDVCIDQKSNTASIPGWFGKGFNSKRFRKKKV